MLFQANKRIPVSLKFSAKCQANGFRKRLGELKIRPQEKHKHWYWHLRNYIELAKFTWEASHNLNTVYKCGNKGHSCCLFAAL